MDGVYFMENPTNMEDFGLPHFRKPPYLGLYFSHLQKTWKGMQLENNLLQESQDVIPPSSSASWFVFTHPTVCMYVCMYVYIYMQ